MNSGLILLVRVKP